MVNETTDVRGVADCLISEVFDLRELQRLQDVFSAALGVASIITQPDGTPVTEPSGFTDFCLKVVRGTCAGLENCKCSDAALGRYNPEGPIVQRCLSAGLWDAGVSVSVGSRHVGNWLIGQVRNEQLSEQKILEYAAQIGADTGEFAEALKQVPEMPFEQFCKAAELLFIIANRLSQGAHENRLLQENRDQLNITLNSIGEGLIVTDNAGRIQRMNRTAGRLLDRAPEESLGCCVEDVFRFFDESGKWIAGGPVYEVLRTGRSAEGCGHLEIKSESGLLHVSCTVAPVTGVAGAVQGAVLVFRDVSEQRISAERLKLATSVAGVGIWEYDPRTRRIMCDDQMHELYGLQPSEETGYVDAWKALVHPDDLPDLLEHVFRVLAGEDVYDAEYRIIRPDGEVRYIHAQGSVIFDPSGQALKVIGTNWDITRRKTAEAEYRSLFEHMLDGFALHEVITDGTGRAVDYRFLSVNPAFEEMTGLDVETVTGRTVLEVFPETEPEWIEKYGNVALTGEPARFEQYSEVIGKWFEVYAFSPQKGRFVSVFRDVTVRRRMENELTRKVGELELFNRAAVGRELRMIELKKEVNELRARLGDPVKYERAEGAGTEGEL